MNVGVIPESLLERIALWLGMIPVPVVDVLFGPLKARILMAGVRLGLFEALRDRPRTVTDLAGALRLDPAGLELLLRALSHVGYLEECGECYRLSSLARRTLVGGAPMELSAYVRWNETQWRFLEELDGMVRTGRGVDFHRALEDREAWSDYQRAMLELARLDAPILTRLTPIAAGAARLLDLGGAHGFLGAAICRRHPPLRSAVIDLPRAIEHGRALACAGGYADLVDFRPGDLLTDGFEEGDAALLSNVLHHFTAAQVASVLGRVRIALRPGGTIAIWELEAPRREDAAGHGDVTALFFRLTSTSESHHGSQYATWLAAAGFSGIRILRPRRSPSRVLVLARA
jgi:hypothetical protein